MSRSLFLRSLTRIIRIAHFCEERGIPTNEGLERLADMEARAAKWRLSRRGFLANTGRLALSGAIGSVVGSFQSALSVQRSRHSVSIGIVGAGLSGLVCGDELRRRGINATIYDANERVGGRCFSLRGFFPGQIAERGGEFIDNLHKTMLGYVNEFKLRVEDVEKEPSGEVFYFFNGQRYPESVVVDEYRDLVPVMHDDLRTLTPPTADDHTDADVALDFTNLLEYLETRGAGDVIKAAIKEAYIAEYGLEIEEQSCLNFLLFIHADRRFKFRPFGIFSDERYHVIDGNDKIVEGIRNRLERQIRLGMLLVRARKKASGEVELTFKNGSRTITVSHDAVVFAIPFSTLREVELDSSLGIPPWKLLAIKELRYGTNAKMMVGFSGRPWIALGSRGTSYSDLPNHQNTWETNPINATNTRAVLTDYSGGNRGASLDPKRVQREASLFLGDLDVVYPGALAAATRGVGGDFRVYLEHWPSNPLTRGSYTCNHPGYFTTIADNEAKPVGNLYFAGEHTSSFYEWQGFMEGAALSGIRAAREILRDMRFGAFG